MGAPPIPRPRLFGRYLSPLAIASAYAVAGIAWILLSDQLVARLAAGLPLSFVTWLQSSKGVLYVAASAVLLHVLIRQGYDAVRAAEEARREGEHRYRQLFEEAGACALLLDAETGEIVEANPAACRFYGYEREELVGRRISEINTSPEAVARNLPLAREERRCFFFRHRLATGEIRDVEVHSTPVTLGGRRLLYSIIHDITEQRRAEERLARSEANYRGLLEQASDGILILDAGLRRIVEANPRASELLGHSAGELRALGPADLIPAEDLAAEPLRLEDLEAGRVVLIERRLLRRDGSLLHAELSSRRLSDGRVQAIIRDIGERRLLEEQLRQAQKMEAIGQLTGGIAHDLNNLLGVVLTNAELIERSVPPERTELVGDIQDLRAAAQRGATMISKLLSFSRTAPLTLETIDLWDVVSGLSGTLRRLLPADIEITQSRDAAPHVVRADPGAVEQMLLNLATNARDAMPRGGRLRIEVGAFTVPAGGAARWRLPGPYVSLSVSDDGVGMDAATRARVFEPFFTTKAPGQGSGLGMAMIYGLTKQHGGFTEVDSAPGRGTTVRICLPAAPGRGSAKPPEDEIAELVGGRERILLVEDEESLRRVGRRVLERLGYTVATAENGRVALDLLDGGLDVDLVISDLVMPQVGGRALYEALRARGARVNFLFTSGYAGPKATPRDLPSGGWLFLPKPWSIAELAAKTREALDRAHAA